MDLITITRALAHSVNRLTFADPVAQVYNPLEYAWLPHEAYLQRFGRGTREVVLVGMNPGPFGMVQTGVPFGDVTMVREWMGLEAPVTHPAQEHPRRPIAGFACRRREVSGARLWGWARERFGAPESFFARFFVVNYCPLAFLEAGGKNRTPDKLPVAEREALYACCDRALRDMMITLAPRYVIGIGDFAAKRVAASLVEQAVTTGQILHPSPANPRANTGWAVQAEADLRAVGILI